MVQAFLRLVVFVIAVSPGLDWACVEECQPTPPPAIDVNKPQSWDFTVPHSREKLDALARALIAIAKDDKTDIEIRRDAIRLLGKISNNDSLTFLVANVTLKLPVRRVLGDEDVAKMWPCLQALMSDRSDNWDVPKAVFESLGSPKSDVELVYLSSAVEKILGPTVTRQLIDDELSKRPEPTRKKNLDAMKKLLSGDPR